MKIKRKSPEKVQKKKNKAYKAILLASSLDYGANNSDVLAELRNELHISEAVHLECENRVRDNDLVDQMTREGSGSN